MLGLVGIRCVCLRPSTGTERRARYRMSPVRTLGSTFELSSTDWNNCSNSCGLKHSSSHILWANHICRTMHIMPGLRTNCRRCCSKWLIFYWSNLFMPTRFESRSQPSAVDCAFQSEVNSHSCRAETVELLCERTS